MSEQEPIVKGTILKGVAYTLDFKILMRKNPRVFSKFLELESKLDKVGQKLSDGNITVELLQIKGVGAEQFDDYKAEKEQNLYPNFKVTIGNQILLC